MTKRMKRWTMLVAITGPTLFGMSCTSQLRDALASGLFDFVAGSTTDQLSAAIFPEGSADPLQIEIAEE